MLIGRAYAYGLGASGGPGVTRAIDILRARDGRYVGLSDEMLALLAEEWPDQTMTDAMQEALDRLAVEAQR